MDGLIHKEHKLIEHQGKPLFVLVPFEDYQELFLKDTIPQKVVDLHVEEGKSLIQAWREYKGFSQKKLASKMGISQPAYSYYEKSGKTLKRATLQKIANALEISFVQLTLED